MEDEPTMESILRTLRDMYADPDEVQDPSSMPEVIERDPRVEKVSLFATFTPFECRGYDMAEEKELPKRQNQDRGPRCPACAASLHLAEHFLDPSTNKTVRLYQCQCGQRVWEE